MITKVNTDRLHAGFDAVPDLLGALERLISDCERGIHVEFGGSPWLEEKLKELDYARAAVAKAKATDAEAAAQELRKDAERYRWLRDMIKNQDLTIAKVGSWSLESWSGDDPDHYIDAAMEKQE